MYTVPVYFSYIRVAANMSLDMGKLFLVLYGNNYSFEMLHMVYAKCQIKIIATL